MVKWHPLQETGNLKGVGFDFLKRHAAWRIEPDSERTEQVPIQWVPRPLSAVQAAQNKYFK